MRTDKLIAYVNVHVHVSMCACICVHMCKYVHMGTYIMTMYSHVHLLARVRMYMCTSGFNDV